MQIWIVKGYIKLRYFWRRGNLVVVCVTAYVIFYCHLISLFYSDFVILGRFSCRGIDLLDLKQNKCWYNSMRDLNFCICIGLRLYRGHIRGDEIWKRSKERSTVFAKYMLDIASLFKIFFRELFSFSSTRSHQGFIASIYLVHFHHIIRTFYKCHKCVTPNKLFSFGFVWYYLQKESPPNRCTLKIKVYETVNLLEYHTIIENIRKYTASSTSFSSNTR